MDGPNRYAFVRNNPLRYADPTGYVAQDKTRLEPSDLGVVNPDEVFINATIVAKDPCPSCPAAAQFGHDVAGPGNDIFGALGDAQEGWYTHVRDTQIAARTKVSRTGKVRPGKPSATSVKGIAAGRRIGYVGDALQAVDSGLSAVQNVSDGRYGSAFGDLLEGGLNIWGGRIGAGIGLKCGPGAVVCSPVLGYIGGKSGTFLRAVHQAGPEIHRAIQDPNRKYDLRFGLPR